MGGQQNGAFSNNAWYLRPAEGVWHGAGSTSPAVNRPGAAVLIDDLYQVGGYLPCNETVGTLDRYRAAPCERCRYAAQVALDGSGSVSYDPAWPCFLAGEVARLNALPG